MSIKSLAEGIILQSVEDLWNGEFSNESLDFFKGGEFRACAEMAGMSLIDQVKLLNLVKGVIDYQKKKIPIPAYTVIQEKEGRKASYRRETSCFVR